MCRKKGDKESLKVCYVWCGRVQWKALVQRERVLVVWMNETLAEIFLQDQSNFSIVFPTLLSAMYYWRYHFCTMKISFCPSKIPFKVFLFHILWYAQKYLTTVSLQMSETNPYHTDQYLLIVPLNFAIRLTLALTCMLHLFLKLSHISISLSQSYLACYSV